MAESKIIASLVTVNWNGKRFLERLLPLLEKQNFPRDAFEIVVVDNFTTKDDSVAYIKKNFPNVVLIENTRNDGFAGGCNIGIRASSGKYIVLINNDTEPDKDWLKALVECADRKKAGAVVSKLMFKNRPGIINNAGSILEPNASWPIRELGANEKDGPKYNKEIEITAVCGASVLLSRAMLEQIGIFDENFFMYFEDGDLSWRGQKAGWKYYYCPKSVVVHEHSGSSGEHSDFFTYYVTRNRQLILLKHSSLGIVARSYASFLRDFLVRPSLGIIAMRNRRHNLRNLRLFVKIQLALLTHAPNSLLKRLRLLREASLK